MNTCKQCGIEFPSSIWKDGKSVSLHGRKICLDCSPWKSGKRYSAINPNRSLTCRICGKEKKRSGTRCNACISSERRWNTKLKALEILGDKCSICGWDKHPAGLDFHHPNDDKDRTPADALELSWKKAWAELKKCKVLCACCHRMEHCKFNPSNRIGTGQPQRTR